jgi:hypothetical protein
MSNYLHNNNQTSGTPLQKKEMYSYSVDFTKSQETKGRKMYPDKMHCKDMFMVFNSIDVNMSLT